MKWSSLTYELKRNRATTARAAVGVRAGAWGNRTSSSARRIKFTTVTTTTAERTRVTTTATKTSVLQLQEDELRLRQQERELENERYKAEADEEQRHLKLELTKETSRASGSVADELKSVGLRRNHEKTAGWAESVAQQYLPRRPLSRNVVIDPPTNVTQDSVDKRFNT